MSYPYVFYLTMWFKFVKNETLPTIL